MTTTITSITAVLLVVGQWFILEKMGEDGWKALIPFYGTYLLFKHAWNTKMYWISLALIGGVCISAVAGTLFAFSGSIALAVTMILLAVAAGIATFVIDVRFMYELCKRFGHGAGYAAGMVFFEPVFTLVLGLGQDEFVEV